MARIPASVVGAVALGVASIISVGLGAEADAATAVNDVPLSLSINGESLDAQHAGAIDVLSLQLQMDRNAQILSSLSNISKKLSDTQQAVIRQIL